MFTLLRVYDDWSSATEQCNDMVAALEAAAIALRDPSCISVKIWERQVGGAIIMDYYRG